MSANTNIELRRPWLVAVWPGMGNVALNAGVYLLAKLRMTLLAEYEAADLFDVDHVTVEHGLVQAGHLPRNRFFVWKNANGGHDIVVFLGEAQPPLGKQRFCRQVIEYARGLGVERVFTFAAMATEMRPGNRPRVFGAATTPAGVDELQRLEVAPLNDGQISGLNGVLIGVAAEAGLPGACLLGEMPHLFAQFPFPRASLAVLEAFTTMANVHIDLAELSEQATESEEHLGEMLARAEEAYGRKYPGTEPAEEFRGESATESRLSGADAQRLEKLFEQAARDRSKAFELKRELDRLGAFKEYEDRFLNLFRRAG